MSAVGILDIVGALNFVFKSIVNHFILFTLCTVVTLNKVSTQFQFSIVMAVTSLIF